MMMIYTLILDDDDYRAYQVVSDNVEGTVTVDKQTHMADSHGQFSSMFSKEFIEKLAIGTLKFKTNPPKRFVYGVG
ncbi:hypothetical protein [Lactiplantibacillus pentosus]|jgi:hypothetical protein|uniref:hypothetical protein n=1 Tax=Lactiplantibacillus pentosus TaxID=1589 RepID=UPI0020796638|nr:hypothetical protein [Lactiplantibacillus pentosus]USJ85015.1 hypothetical protein KSF55_09455 [Lactiplantibacillus pentosus]